MPEQVVTSYLGYSILVTNKEFIVLDHEGTQLFSAPTMTTIRVHIRKLRQEERKLRTAQFDT